jgi:hypothetical protein
MKSFISLIVCGLLWGCGQPSSPPVHLSKQWTLNKTGNNSVELWLSASGSVFLRYEGEVTKILMHNKFLIVTKPSKNRNEPTSSSKESEFYLIVPNPENEPSDTDFTDTYGPLEYDILMRVLSRYSLNFSDFREAYPK